MTLIEFIPISEYKHIILLSQQNMKQSQSKIFFLLPSLAGGGAEKVVLDIFSEMQPYNVSLILLNAEGALSATLPQGANVKNLGITKGRYAVLALTRFFKKHKPDVVFTTMAYFNFIVVLALILSRHKPKKIILREANVPEATLNALPVRWLGNFIYRFTYNRSSLIICNSNQTKIELLRVGIKNKLIKVIRNPVSVKNIRERALLKSDLEQHIHNKSPFFVYVGRLTTQKGVDELIRAIGKMEHATQLLIIGNGEEENALRLLAVEEQIDKNVKFLGFKDNPYPYMSAATAIILPSRWEGLPNVGLEALALGKIVVASKNTGGLAELAYHVPSSKLVFVDDSNELTTLLDLLASKYDGNPETINNNVLPPQFDKEKVIAEYRDALIGV